MGHPMGRIPHNSWATRRQLMPEIPPEFMGHPTSAQMFFPPRPQKHMESHNRTVQAQGVGKCEDHGGCAEIVRSLLE